MKEQRPSYCHAGGAAAALSTSTLRSTRKANDGYREAAAGRQTAVDVRVVDCLNECDRSNVAVLKRPGVPARERDTWLGGLLTDRATDARGKPSHLGASFRAFDCF